MEPKLIRFRDLFVLCILTCLIFLIFLQPTVSQNVIGQAEVIPKSNIGAISSIHISSDPISINGDTEFNTTASQLGWLGNGTSTSPYVIEGIRFNNETVPLVAIYNTRVHFVFQINEFHVIPSAVEGSWLYLFNVSNGVIHDNLFTGAATGIELDDSFDVNITSNQISDSRYSGISLKHSHNIRISDNSIQGSAYAGIFLGSTSWSDISQNTITDSVGDVGRWGYGIRIIDSYQNRIAHNFVKKNRGDGLSILGSFDTTLDQNRVDAQLERGIHITGGSDRINLTGNLVLNNQYSGISLWEAADNFIFNNTVFNNGWDGLWLRQALNTVIRNCTFINNKVYGVSLHWEGNENNLIQWSNFIANTWRESTATYAQITNGGVNTTFRYNYYSHIWQWLRCIWNEI
ncbi:MAG: nitrous oxide reductase family maturation protein NosD [Candidatus Heimdallarchaeota archaeon]